jgi:hypothetical protein
MLLAVDLAERAIVAYDARSWDNCMNYPKSSLNMLADERIFQKAGIEVIDVVSPTRSGMISHISLKPKPPHYFTFALSNHPQFYHCLGPNDN